MKSQKVALRYILMFRGMTLLSTILHAITTGTKWPLKATICQCQKITNCRLPPALSVYYDYKPLCAALKLFDLF